MAAVFEVGVDRVDAEVLAQRQKVVDAMLEFIAQATLDLAEIVVVRVALIEVGDRAVGGIVEGRRAAGDRTRELAENGQLGVLVRLEGEGGREIELVVRIAVQFGVGEPPEPGHAIEQRAVLVGGAG